MVLPRNRYSLSKQARIKHKATISLYRLLGVDFFVRFFFVERGGFEPPKSLTTDLQSAPFGHSGTSPYGAGDRNRTNNLLITNQLLCLLSYTSVLSCWCLGADSNHRHRDFQSLALPPELPRHTGFQSPFEIYGSDGCHCHKLDGDPEGARTPDLQRDRLAY